MKVECFFHSFSTMLLISLSLNLFLIVRTSTVVLMKAGDDDVIIVFYLLRKKMVSPTYS